MNWEKVILDEIADKNIKRKSVSLTYRFLLQEQDPKTDWVKINQAIIARWSHSALQFIKERAWSGKCFDVLETV